MSGWLDGRFPRHRTLWAQVEPQTPTDDLSHDADHLARVYRWSLRLAPEAGAGPDLAGAAALVHDLVSIPKDDARRPLAGAESAREALAPLAAAGYDEQEIVQIAEAVRTSSWSSGLTPTAPLGRVLQDADRLDAIGAVGIARTFACAQRMVQGGRAMRLCEPDDPLARRRAPDEARFALDHFQTKLLRLAEGMHLPTARAEARQRHALMATFLEQLESSRI